MLTVDNVNLEPNKRWYFALAGLPGGISVKIYLSRADALADTNVVAQATTTSYGSNIEVTLTQVATSPQISFFNAEIPWHCVVSGESMDTSKVYQIGPFTDLDPVNHAIYRNDAIIYYRAASLIDEATHLDIATTINTPNIPAGLAPGDCVRVNSDELNIDRYLFCRGIEYQLSPSSMTATILASKFERVKR